MALDVVLFSGLIFHHLFATFFSMNLASLIPCFIRSLSLPKTPGAQIGVRGCFGAPGAAEYLYTWNGDLALGMSVVADW